MITWESIAWILSALLTQFVITRIIVKSNNQELLDALDKRYVHKDVFAEFQKTCIVRHKEAHLD